MYNPEIHHRHSIRLRQYDYTSCGAYFLTICTSQRECLFGEIASGAVVCNDAGNIVRNEWQKLQERFPTVEIDDFIVMPNHFHGIVVLKDYVGVGLALPDSGVDKSGPQPKQGAASRGAASRGAASSAPTKIKIRAIRESPLQNTLTMDDRYDTSHLLEDQYEPGSNSLVLRNKLGIIDPDEMGIAETAALWRVQEKLIGEIAADHSFSAHDICEIHRQWLESIYPWAGIYRQVNIGKGGFQFAMAYTIPTLMAELERNQLRKYTPCQFEDRDGVAHALAEVHVELMLIHPFREGNGRLGRLLATMMALQAGLPVLDFSELDGARREEYFAAVRAGMDMNYLPMKRLFNDVIERSLQASQEP